MAFVDVDWDAESEQSAKASIYKQTLYMSRSQLQVYFDDLSTIDSAGMMGGQEADCLTAKKPTIFTSWLTRFACKREKRRLNSLQKNSSKAFPTSS